MNISYLNNGDYVVFFPKEIKPNHIFNIGEVFKVLEVVILPIGIAFVSITRDNETEHEITEDSFCNNFITMNDYRKIKISNLLKEIK